MKKNRVASIFVALLMLLTFVQPVLAQDYYFEVPEAQVDIFIETDGTITIEYYYSFRNAGGAHVIDYVDIGMPGNSTYQLSDISANVDGKPITDISSSPYVDGVALGLGANAIPAGGSGVVYMRAENVGNLFY